MRCSFHVLGPPQPKERARWCPTRKRHVTPPKTRAYEDLVGRIALHARPRTWDFRGAYAVEIHAYLHDRRARDLDNISKSVLDGLNRVLWLDDRQVVRLLVDKAIDPERPRIEVVVDVVQR